MLIAPFLATAPSSVGDSPITVVAFLAGAAAAIYVAVRACENALMHRPVLGFAVAASLPTLGGAILAVSTGHEAAGLALLLGVAVACVTLVLGMGLNTRPDAPPAADVPAIPVPTLAAGPSAGLLPVALAVLFAGFVGTFAITSALLIFAAGMAGWLFASPALRIADRTQSAHIGVIIVQLILAVALGVAGIALVGAGSELLGRQMGRELESIGATVLAAPMMALPLIGIATKLAVQRRRDELVAGAAVSAVMLLGIALPLTLATAILMRVVNGAESWSIVLPLRLWRIDTVLIALAGLLLLPVAARRWLPGAIEGLGLTLLYVAYLVVSVAASR